MLKKCLFLMLFMLALIPIFSFHEKILADKVNSKAGITFSNSYVPTTIIDSLIPDGSNLVIDTSDDQINKKELPKTGGQSFYLFQYLGLSSIIAAFVMLLTLARSNNRKNRNASFYLNK